MKNFFLLILFLPSFVFAQQNQDTSVNSLRKYLKHFSSLDSGTFFFRTHIEHQLMDISIKSKSVFSFVKQNNLDTSFLFLDNSITDMGESNTYFQDGEYYYKAQNLDKTQNVEKLQKKIHILRKQPINWRNILSQMRTSVFTGLTASRDYYINNRIFNYYPRVTEKDTAIKGIIYKQFRLTFANTDTNQNKIVRIFRFRVYDSLLFYFYEKHIYLDDTTYSEHTLDSFSRNTSTQILLRAIDKKKKHFLRTCTVILETKKTNDITRKKPLVISDTLADFEGVDTNGTLIKIRSFKDKYILLDFWNVACGPCTYAVKPLIKLYLNYKDKGLEVISLNSTDDLAAIKRYVKWHSITYTSLHIDEEDEQSFGFEGYPSFFLFDTNHKLVFTTRGFSPDLYERLSSAFEKFIQK